MESMSDTDRKTGGQVLERTKPKVKKPELFKVLLHNDDYTTMQFVIEVLEEIFNKSPAEAFRVMMHVHTRGHGVCGSYPYEVAETKVQMVHDRANANGFPLKASMEEA
jgi:ATP-dependent Clp protease adaptor protein ClpS